jgi:outer membrane lipoprotein-sorting protein
MKKIMILSLPLFISTVLAIAQSPEDKGLEIAQKAEAADKGFESSKVSLKMILTNKQGQNSERLLENQTLELHDDGDKSLIVFHSPKDVAGTATLTYTHKSTADDQWLYLPALKRVKRISSDNKSGPFMGSEFAYEDLSSQEVEKYKYKFVKEDNINGNKAYIVERYPVDPKSGYTKQVVWYHQENFRIEKTDYYDRKGTLMKTLTFHDYKQYLNKHWRAGELVMENHLSAKKTRLLFENYSFKTGLNDQDFSQNSLARAGK